MNAKIDREGILWIERAGEFKQMHCAKRHDHYCRDVCPLFGEMEAMTPAGWIWKLELCEGKLISDEITDERGTPWAPEEKDE